MPPPTNATSAVFPDWTDLVDNWREADAEWLRNRSVQVFPDAASRTTALGTPPMFGMLSIVQSGSVAGGPDFWNGSAHESIRYPNLNVISDSTSVTLRRQGAGTGVQLLNDGSVNIAKEFVGTGGQGSTQDSTGVAIKIGAKTVKLATDATSLTIDSPVTVSGAISASSVSAPNITSTTAITAAAINASGTVTAASVTASGAVTGASVTGGDVLLGTSGVYGTVKHRSGGTSQIGVGSDSTVRIDGATLTLNLPVTAAQAVVINGTTSFVGRPSLALPSTTPVWVAGIIAVSGNVAPSQNAPDGTIYITY